MGAHHQGKRTERSVYSVTTHAHARTAVARITQRMWHMAHMHTCTLCGHFGQGGFCFLAGAASCFPFLPRFAKWRRWEEASCEFIDGRMTSLRSCSDEPLQSKSRRTVEVLQLQFIDRLVNTSVACRVRYAQCILCRCSSWTSLACPSS